MALTDELSAEQVIAHTRRWVRDVVIDLNLCPFARREYDSFRLRFVVSTAESDEALLADLTQELAFLERDRETETTLLIHPRILGDFLHYNQFLDRCDQLLERHGYAGRYQVASFHPDYRFAGTPAEAAENYTNRSPYPMLHLLREDSISRAVAGHPDIDGIPVRNIDLLQRLGEDRLRDLWRACFDG